MVARQNIGSAFRDWLGRLDGAGADVMAIGDSCGSLLHECFVAISHRQGAHVFEFAERESFHPRQFAP